MKVIDTHAHIYPPKIAEKAAESVCGFYAVQRGRYTGYTDELLEIIKHGKISHFLVQSVAVVPHHVRNINDFIAKECELHPEFTGFGTLHPDMDDPCGEIDRVVSLGLKGLKFHPDTQHFNMDDEKMNVIYSELSRRGLPVLMHCGDYRFDYSHPRRLAHILDEFPSLTVIAAHFGAWSKFDLAVEYLENRHCYLDVSSSMDYIGLRRTAELIRHYGPDRILFGSDFPMNDPEEHLHMLLDTDIPDDFKEKILYKNAAELLDIT